MKRKGALALRVVICAIAVFLVASSVNLPLWEMKLVAPQYPDGLRIVAFGDHVGGDLREVNILNQYIGMKEITEHPAAEMALFPWSIGGLLILLLVAPFNRWIYRLAAFGAFAVPVGILADMQFRLGQFGHHLSDDAPIRLKPFTPLVLGPSHVGQFMTTAALQLGGEALIAAGIVMLAGLFFNRRIITAPAAIATIEPGTNRKIAPAAVALLIASVALTTSRAARADESLQTRIDRAQPGAILVVRGGVYKGSIAIRKPLRLIGENAPVIDALGHGSVIFINSSDVTVRGFVLRNSGSAATEEAAGVKARGSRNVIEHNVIRDVHFGIQAFDGEGDVIRRNRIQPGRGRGYRGGDGINLWSLRNSTIEGNEISDTRDGIYMSFTSGLNIRGNDITRGRYAIHSMFSQQVTVAGNRLHDNLLGAALMNSDSLLFADNRVERQRAGSTPYGVLLKDIGNLVLERNTFLQNRVAIYADGTPDSPDHRAIIRNNEIVGNDAAFSLQNSVRLIVTENAIIDNMSDVVSEESSLSAENKWSWNGRGNYWSEYRGFDANGDGVGEVPYRVEGSFDYLLQRNPSVRAFLYTPAHTALDLAARMFPLFRPDPLITDPDPLMRPPQTRKAL